MITFRKDDGCIDCFIPEYIHFDGLRATGMVTVSLPELQNLKCKHVICISRGKNRSLGDDRNLILPQSVRFQSRQGNQGRIKETVQIYLRCMIRHSKVKAGF